MAHTSLMQRLLKLTKLAQQAKKQKANVNEYAEQNLFTRRRFLGNSAKAALAATALAGCSKVVDSEQDSACSNDNDSATNPSIVIIGAGIAGLNAAYNLQKNGVFSTIYDANRRSGGRIFTAQNLLNSALSTELGGEFIDTGHHEMRSLAKEFNLPLIDLYSHSELKLQQNIYYFNGVAYSDADFLNEVGYYLPAINNDYNSLSDIIKYNSYSPADAKFDSMNLEQYLDSISLTGWLRELLLVAYVGEYGLNTDKCNAINFLFLFGEAPNGDVALYGSSDERFKVSGGNQRITDALYDKLKNCIHLESQLVKIESKGTGYNLYFENCANAVQADIVLLTLPFTLLREVETNVELPKIKRKAINQLSYGDNSKLLLGFNGRKWRTKYNSVGMAYTDNGVQNCWDNSQLQPSNNGGLTVFLGGTDAVKLGNKSAQEQASKYLKELNQIYPGVKDDYNNKAYTMVWPEFPLTKASYSAYTVGQYTTIAGSEGETVDNLFFAGEHTSYNYQGFMNGGAVSGRIAAERILKRIGK